jgi:hypothetical protein
MKKLISLTTLTIAFAAALLSQEAPPAPTIVVTTNTVVTTTTQVQPITLPAGEVDTLIEQIKAAGITSSVPINSTNLMSLNLRKLPNGTNFILYINLK